VAGNTSVGSMVCFIVAAFLGAVGQFLYKSGAATAKGGLLSYLVNLHIIGGVICYMAVMVLFVAAFKQGGSLMILYPIYASTFIWAALTAWHIEGNSITLTNVFGMGLIIAGMFFLAWKP
jgi:uncharacterized membrane protein